MLTVYPFVFTDLADLITRIASRPLKGVTIQAQLCKISSSIRIRNISNHYDDEFIPMYFESRKRSGGGDVASFELLGNGEAVVTFKDPEGITKISKFTLIQNFVLKCNYARYAHR